jgi:hypothetical protein
MILKSGNISCVDSREKFADSCSRNRRLAVGVAQVQNRRLGFESMDRKMSEAHPSNSGMLGTSHSGKGWVGRK